MMAASNSYTRVHHFSIELPSRGLLTFSNECQTFHSKLGISLLQKKLTADLYVHDGASLCSSRCRKGAALADHKTKQVHTEWQIKLPTFISSKAYVRFEDTQNLFKGRKGP